MSNEIDPLSDFIDKEKSENDNNSIDVIKDLASKEMDASNTEDTEFSQTIKSLTDFYGKSGDKNKSKIIKIKRIHRPERILNNDISIIKQRLKDCQIKQQDERKAIKEKRFMKNRNIEPAQEKEPKPQEYFNYITNNYSVDEEEKDQNNLKNAKKMKKFKPNINTCNLSKKYEEMKNPSKIGPSVSRYMAEDDEEDQMIIQNKKLHFVTIGSKSLANKVSSSDDDYEFYQVTEERQGKRDSEDGNELKYINEEEQSENSYDSEDSNRADQEWYEYGGDDEDEDGCVGEEMVEYMDKPTKGVLIKGMEEEHWVDRYSDDDDSIWY